MANKMKSFVRNPGNIAFCYYRYSSDAQRDVSIDQQKKEAHDFAEKNGYIIPKDGEFEDRGITGTTLDRPGLNSMLWEAKHKRPAYLILWKLDRLSREIHDSFSVDAQLRNYGVQIVTVAEQLPEDEGLRYAIQGLYASIAHQFIIAHSSNVLRGLNYNAKNCLYNGRKLLGYIGQPNERYRIDPDTEPIVKKIFSDYVSGKPLQKIADELNASGLRTVQGNKFVVNSLAHILRNRAYIGEYKWGDHLIPDGMPRIISSEVFEAAGKRLEKNRRGGKTCAHKLKLEEIDFWLTGHVYCGECGSPLHGISGTSKSGKKYYYYTCLNHKKKKCELKNQPKEMVEKIIEYTLDKMLEDSTWRLFFSKMCYDYYEESMGEDRGAYLATLKNNLKSVEDKLNNFVKAISAGVFNDTTQQAMKELENQKYLLTEQIEAEELREKCDIKLETIVKYFEGFVGNLRNEEYRNHVLDILVDKIYLYSDRLIITFHFTDDRRELSYQETIEMIENYSYILDCVKNPEENSVINDKVKIMMNSITGKESTNSDFF